MVTVRENFQSLPKNVKLANFVGEYLIIIVPLALV